MDVRPRTEEDTLRESVAARTAERNARYPANDALAERERQHEAELAAIRAQRQNDADSISAILSLGSALENDWVAFRRQRGAAATSDAVREAALRALQGEPRPEAPARAPDPSGHWAELAERARERGDDAGELGARIGPARDILAGIDRTVDSERVIREKEAAFSLAETVRMHLGRSQHRALGGKIPEAEARRIVDSLR